mmetsp:Transcript_50426/g.113386  ORF Transcript_50426/g.113386 Transcript_50426/m.113386 type:complete len:350 (-) Transcript_50426:95-1144(-)
MPVLDGRRDTNALIELVNQQYIQESPQFLLAGSILGVNGFLIAVIPYLLRVGENLYRGQEIPIDEVPPTVSELVSKWETVEARIFFGFELTGAFCILLSWYPYKLRNVCCIPAAGGCRIPFRVCGHMSWATFRQFMPPIGLILVACCPTVKLGGLKAQEVVLVGVHCLAAMMMFVGFILAEAHALSIKFFYPVCVNGIPKITYHKCTKPTVDPGTLHYRMRYAAWNLAALFFCCFLVVQGLGGAKIIAMDTRRRYRILSFVCEVVAGLSMLSNMIIIWYFSPERLWSRRGLVGDWSHATVQPISSPSTHARSSHRESSGSQCQQGADQDGIELPDAWQGGARVSGISTA